MLRRLVSYLFILPHLFLTKHTVFSLNYVAYFIEWGIYDRNFQVSDIPFNSLTHINYAFANLDANGQLLLGDTYAATEKIFVESSNPLAGNFGELKKYKSMYPHIKILISVGGWTWSTHFSTVAASDTLRQNFAASCASFLSQYDFLDGIDIDWEYPVEGGLFIWSKFEYLVSQFLGLASNTYNPSDGQNYNLLLQAIRNSIGSYKLLTIAAPAGPHLTRHLDLAGMSPIVDFVNIMTYDFRGGWSKFTGHHSPLLPSSVDPDTSLTDTFTVIQHYLKNGMQASKINIGAAMYGRAWLGAPNTNNGLFQTFSSIPAGTWDKGGEATGVFDYWDIISKLSSGQLMRYWDNEVLAPWLYDGSSMMISYDDIESMTAKCEFVRAMGLGGIMVWELAGDKNYDLSAAIIAACFEGKLQV